MPVAGGKRLVFVNAEGQFLFDMRVMGPNKSWKELAATFRGQVSAFFIIIILIMIINLVYIAQSNTNDIPTALHIVIMCIQAQYMHIRTYMKQSYSYTWTHVQMFFYYCYYYYEWLSAFDWKQKMREKRASSTRLK